MSLNQVNLIGNITRDIEMRYTPSGMATCKFGLAMNKKFKGSDGSLREDVCFVDIQLWGKTAEAAQQYLGKGRQVFITGSLKLDQWNDKNTGEKRTKLFVVGREWNFVGPKKDGDGQQQSRPAQQKPRQQAAPQDANDAPPVDLEIQEESVPF